jgi:hypothetical protein
MVEHGCQAEDIAALVDWPTGKPFGASVLGIHFSGDRRWPYLVEGCVQGEADKFDLRPALVHPGHQDSVRREISMDNSRPMRCLQAGRSLEDKIEGFHWGEALVCRQEVRKRFAAQLLEHHVERAAL